MRIGEFAKAAGIPASVLRLYGKKGLLVPDYIDHFSGYRYYSAAQLKTVRRITLLKQAGLSLKEIKKILEKSDDFHLAADILDRREEKYRNMLGNLREAKNEMLNENNGSSVIPEEIDGITEEIVGEEILLKSAPLPLPPDPQDLTAAHRRLEEAAEKLDYQRISGFMTYEGEHGNTLQVVIRAIKLQKDTAYLL